MSAFALYTIGLLGYWVIGLLRSKFWLLTTDFRILHSDFFKGCWLSAPGFWLQPAVVRSL
ncbi:MAG: hypothetical protein AB1765_10035 [Candidatus Hydrogenedentota bacterium]